MSVPVNQRSHGKLEACVKAHALCCYTLRITSNKKVFTSDFQAALTDKIDETVLNMYTLCWTANNKIIKREAGTAKTVAACGKIVTR